MRRLGFVLACLAVPLSLSAQTIAPYSTNVTIPAFIVGGSGAGALADGTSGAPSIAFASAPTVGFWKSGASTVTMQGGLTVTGSLTTSTAATSIFIGTRGAIGMFGDGIFQIVQNAQSIGALLKVDALPVASACGTGSPAVVAGSTPMTGSVTVGTGAPATCTITFGGTAYPSSPHCNGAVETTTAANARAMGYSASTTVLTIVPATAWADSSVVNWDCFSSK